jgi:DNA-binding CsgD family transcriptional regulator
MSISVSGSFSSEPATAAHSPSDPSSDSSDTGATEKTAVASADTVKLSQAAQVHLFKQQGQSLSQIAANLGISLSTVDGYLGVAVAKAASTPIPTNAPVALQSGTVEPTPVPTKS